jgi:hypothetical protein
MRIIIFAILVILILISGCTEPTGCIPVKIDGKYVTTSPNVHILTIQINKVNYTYYNPTLDTFSKIEINETYLMRFQPMSGRPCVELCT